MCGSSLTLSSTMIATPMERKAGKLGPSEMRRYDGSLHSQKAASTVVRSASDELQWGRRFMHVDAQASVAYAFSSRSVSVSCFVNRIHLIERLPVALSKIAVRMVV